MATTTDKYILELDTAQAERGITKTNTGFKGMLAGLTKLGPAAGLAAAGLAAIGGVKAIGNKINELDDLAKAARNAGANTQEQLKSFQTLGTVLEDSGISSEKYSQALSQTMDRLAKGGAQAESVLSKIGPALQNANGELKSGPELLQAMVVAFNEGAITAEEFQAVVGSRVGPMIQKALGDTAASAKNLQSAMEGAASSTDLVDVESLANAEKFNDTMAAMGRMVGTVGTSIATALLPYLTDLAEGAMAVLPDIIAGVKAAFSALEPVFSLIGTVISTVLWPAFKLILEVLGFVAAAIKPVIELVAGGLTKVFQILGGVVEGVVNFFKGAVEVMQAIADKITYLKDAVTGAFGSVKDGAVNMAKGAYDGVTGWFGKMYDEVVGNSIIPDMAKGVLGEFDGMGTGMVGFVQDAVGGVVSTMTTLGNAVASKFEEVTGISMSGLKDQVSSMTSYLTTSVSNLASSIGSKLSGLWSKVSSTASNVGSMFGGFNFSNPFENFAGFFANGGNIPKGQFGVVGENGPEMVSGPATVTPMGGGSNVTYNIHAVDASSFRSLLAQDPEFVHRVVQRGSNSANQGRR
tara:strand:- start:12245 stop:13981 length:1737 start_codon:yes stop_codon:yes gene_type:complete